MQETKAAQIIALSETGKSNSETALHVGVSEAHVRTTLNRKAKQGAKHKAKQGAKHKAKQVRKQSETPKKKQVEATPATVAAQHPGLLWVCLALSLGCSIPNMYWVMFQLKASMAQAYIVTGAFTIAPILLIAYGVRGWYRAVPYVVLLAEAMCNAAGFYGGMTGLGHSLYLEPTKFLHMITSMFNTGNHGTALAVSVFFAICIAALAVAPAAQLSKR
jgi:hypothetical protein